MNSGLLWQANVTDEPHSEGGILNAAEQITDRQPLHPKGPELKSSSVSRQLFGLRQIILHKN